MQNPNVLLTSQSIPCAQVPGKLGKPLKDDKWASTGHSLVETRILQLCLKARREAGNLPSRGQHRKHELAFLLKDGIYGAQTDSPDKSRSSKSSGNKNKTITVEQLRERSGRKHMDSKME